MHIIPLWDKKAPATLGSRDVDYPTLTVFPSKKRSAAAPAIVVFPGGGYRYLSEHEGSGYAKWLARHGFTAFVLKYRVGSDGYRHPVPLWDAARASRLVRARAQTFGINPRKVGVIGSSAGGHLAATLLTQHQQATPQPSDRIDRLSARPDFGVLCYPVITMSEPYAHSNSCRLLLGSRPSRKLRDRLSAELQVTPQTQPCFIWHPIGDEAVPFENSLLFAAGLRKAAVPFELHLYECGRHEQGLTEPHPRSAACLHWLANQVRKKKVESSLPYKNFHASSSG